MPGFPAGATPVVQQSMTLSFLDATGDTGTYGVDDYDLAVTAAQMSAVRDAVVNMTNAGLFKDQRGSSEQIGKATTVAFDEAISTVTQGAQFTFQTPSLITRQFTVPAPDLSLFASDGETVDLNNALVVAYRTAMLALLNEGRAAGDLFVLASGVRVDNRRKRGGTRVRPVVAEPTAGQNPPPAPAG